MNKLRQLALLALGLVPALIFAWAFEITPEGIKKESEVDPSQSVAAHTGIGAKEEYKGDIVAGAVFQTNRLPSPRLRQTHHLEEK